MVEPFVIFIAGFGGVLVGMALLYISIRTTSLVTGKLIDKREVK